MLKLEEWMDLRSLYQAGVSVSEVARQTGLDRKTIRKHVQQAPQLYQRAPRPQKIDPYRAYLRERWEQGAHDACKLFREIDKRRCPGTRRGPAARVMRGTRAGSRRGDPGRCHGFAGAGGGWGRSQARMPVPLNPLSGLYLLCFQRAQAVETFPNLTAMLY